MLVVKVGNNLLSNLISFFTFMQCKFIIRNVFLLTVLNLSKSERASNQGIKMKVTTKDIKKGDRA